MRTIDVRLNHCEWHIESHIVIASCIWFWNQCERSWSAAGEALSPRPYPPLDTGHTRSTTQGTEYLWHPGNNVSTFFVLISVLPHPTCAYHATATWIPSPLYQSSAHVIEWCPIIAPPAQDGLAKQIMIRTCSEGLYVGENRRGRSEKKLKRRYQLMDGEM